MNYARSDKERAIWNDLSTAGGDVLRLRLIGCRDRKVRVLRHPARNTLWFHNFWDLVGEIGTIFANRGRDRPL